MLTKISYAVVLLAAAAYAAVDPEAKLTKPPLENGLDYLKSGMLKALGPVAHTPKQWPTGVIPANCKSIAERQKFSAADITAYEVKYTDCDSPWILCRHKDSQGTLDNMMDLFGRVPVKARSWVRHMISLPANAGWAYNLGGDIAMFGDMKDFLTVFIHETSHSLDMLGAYTQQNHTYESTSDNWMLNYNKDPNVPDNYAQSDMLEDVAQVSVVSAFNLNVPGGFPTVEKNHEKLYYQVATIETAQRNAGNLLVPGGECGKRLPNSQPVQVGTKSRMMGKRDDLPDVSLAEGLEVIEPADFDTSTHCKHTW